MIVSTHVLADVERVCDRVAILDRGRLVIEGPLADLLEAHARPIFLLDAGAGPGRRRDRPGREPAGGAVGDRRDGRRRGHDPGRPSRTPPRPPREILPIVVAAGVCLASFERARPTLEDVFLELVGPASSDELDGRGFVRPRAAGPS